MLNIVFKNPFKAFGVFVVVIFGWNSDGGWYFSQYALNGKKYNLLSDVPHITRKHY